MKFFSKLSKSLLGVLLLVITYSCVSAYAANDVLIQDLKLYVDRKEFIVKAMAYQPAPLGIANMTADGYAGGGYCSAKLTVFGEYKSACFGSDYYDGVIAEDGRVPPGPTDSGGKQNSWWYNIWVRDFAKMKDLGVNTIRIYNMNFVTKQFLTMYPNTYKDITNPDRAAQHTQFMDLAHKNGFKVIVPILQDESFLSSATSEEMDMHIEASITELGDHPALLMWCLGNEMGVEKKPDLLKIVNEKMQHVRERMTAIHGRTVPVTHAVVDDPTTYDFLIQNLKVDVFTTNAGYRDVEMEPLWAGESGFKGWKAVSKEKNLPLFIGEIGMHQDKDEITQARPDWFNQQWKHIVNHIDDGTVGACFFEYSDELNKAGQQKHMGAVTFVEATSTDGKKSTDSNVFLPDGIQEKQYVYQAIKQGLDTSFKKYNFNSDVFTLLGRKQSVLEGGVTSPSPDPRESVKPGTSTNPRDTSSASSLVASVSIGLILAICSLVMM